MQLDSMACKGLLDRLANRVLLVIQDPPVLRDKADNAVTLDHQDQLVLLDLLDRLEALDHQAQEVTKETQGQQDLRDQMDRKVSLDRMALQVRKDQWVPQEATEITVQLDLMALQESWVRQVFKDQQVLKVRMVQQDLWEVQESQATTDP